MSARRAHAFAATLEIVGVNPFVFVPGRVLSALLREAGREKGPIAICGTINGDAYRQTLVRYRGEWRLYVNTAMLKDSPRRIGERVRITVALDEASREVEVPLRFTAALEANDAARATFEALTPSRRKEIVRYLGRLKGEDALERNIARALRFLVGDGRFVGREKP